MAVYRPTYTDKKTGKAKQSKTWWYEFIYNGDRVRKSAKTTRKTIALEAEKTERQSREDAFSGKPAAASPSARVKSVKDRLSGYEAEFSVNHKIRAARWVKDRAKYLRRHLSSALVADLTKERMIDYMLARRTEGAGNRTINMEIGILARSLGHTWRILWPKLTKLDETTDVGRALTWDETDSVLAAAARNKSPFIRLFILVALHTGMRTDEIRMLRWKQFDWQRRELVVDESKTEAGRRRPIPLNPTLQAAIEMHLSWYSNALGKPDLGWFLFPHCNRLKPDDPKRPITSVKSAWGSVCKAAGVECRFHDLRHTVCSRMAEAGKSKEAIMEIMGHVSEAMYRRYCHRSAESRREAVLSLERPVSVEVLQESPKVGRSVSVQ
jgi:integrase